MNVGTKIEKTVFEIGKPDTQKKFRVYINEVKPGKSPYKNTACFTVIDYTGDESIFSIKEFLVNKFKEYGDLR